MNILYIILYKVLFEILLKDRLNIECKRKLLMLHSVTGDHLSSIFWFCMQLCRWRWKWAETFGCYTYTYVKCKTHYDLCNLRPQKYSQNIWNKPYKFCKYFINIVPELPFYRLNMILHTYNFLTRKGTRLSLSDLNEFLVCYSQEKISDTWIHSIFVQKIFVYLL